MASHLDIVLQNDVQSTLKVCGLLRSESLLEEKRDRIQSVRIVQPGGNVLGRRARGRSMPSTDMVQLLSFLAKELTGLKRLRLRFRGHSCLPSKAISVFLENAKNLIALRIFDVKFTADNPSELEELATQFRCHPALRKIYLDLCEPYEEEHFASLSLNPIICALADNLYVENIALSNTKISAQSGNLTKLWLEHLGQSPTLKSLKLEMLEEIKNEHVVYLAQAMQSPPEESLPPLPPSLRELCIQSSNLQQSACNALGQMLQTNDSLQRFELVLYQSNNTESDDEAEGPDKEIDWNETGMANALAFNTTMNYFRIFAENISQHGYPDAFAKMLYTNVHLERLVLGWEGESRAPAIDFYLGMNRFGRRHLTERSSKQTWVDFIALHTNDLSVLHYVLTRNPSLVQEMNTVPNS